MEVSVVTGKFSCLRVKSWEPFTLSLSNDPLYYFTVALPHCSEDSKHVCKEWVWFPVQQSVPGSAEEESGSSTAGRLS